MSPNKRLIRLPEHIIEIVSDSGEGAQKAAVIFAQISARMGNGLWTVEIIPSEIQPPPHTIGSASGNRIRLSEKAQVTNAGDFANVIFAFNEMALLSRLEAGAVAKDALILIDNQWATHSNATIRENYRSILAEIKKCGGSYIEIPVEEETAKIIEDTTRGKNMFALGVLGCLYKRDFSLLKEAVAETFAKKGETVINNNLRILEAGYNYALAQIDFQFDIPTTTSSSPMVSMNGNTALALGVIAAGYELCSMYPITPATSASHILADIFEEFGGLVHQAEDEIAAIGVALGSNFVGKPAVTITSGPGMALKTEFQALAVMTETPLVIVDVQRGGPSTGLPTKIEQSDLLSSIFGTPGDAPKVVIAASTIEDCFQIMTLARIIAEDYRTLVIVLSDANLATGQQTFPRPTISEASLPSPLDLGPASQASKPYDWDPTTGLSKRVIPGQAGGMFVADGLNHDADGTVVYDYETNQYSHSMRSRKLAALQKSLKPPTIYGDSSGDLLLVNWGSTRGAIEEAVERAKQKGMQVSSLNIQFLNPLPPGLKEIFSKYKKVMTIELNYSDSWNDPLIDQETRRYSQLALLLRSKTLTDVDCFSCVPGRPIMPYEIFEVIEREINNQRNLNTMHNSL